MSPSAGSVLYYSNNDVPETWTEETARFKLTIINSLAGRVRMFEAIIADPKNVKEAIYTPYRRVKIVEKTSSSIIFLGRAEVSDPFYSNDYGQCLKVLCCDYLRELFDRILNSDYSGSPLKRSALINQIITDYSYAGNLTTNIEASGSSDTVAKDYTKCDKAPVQVIEELAQEDFWTDENWSAAWRWNAASWDNNTTEANSAGGIPFPFLSATGQYFYLGQASNPFLGAEFDLSTFGSYGAQTWQYWNGSSWSNLTISQSYNFTADGTVRWDLPTDWAKRSFSAGDPHTLAPPDGTSRYWVRLSIASVATIAYVYQIKCIRGCGYDYYVDDSQVFQYFRRGSKPSGGPSASGLIIQFSTTETASIRAMLHDYSFCDAPKELITRVTVRGKAGDGTDQSYTATNSTLEVTYKVIKEKIEYVWGSDMDAATLLTYCTNRAKALLGTQAGTITRGECSIIRYPYYGVGKTLVNVGDLVRIKCSLKSIDEDFIILEIKYEEPPGIARLKLISLVYGRSYSPFEFTTVLQGLRTGQDISVATARVQDLIAGTANIADASITSAKVVNLECGKVIITGATTLADWRSADQTKIDGGDIYANSITLTPLGGVVTDRMFDGSAASDNIQGWQHASDMTKIDGGDIQTRSIVADKVNLVSGNLCPSPYFVDGTFGDWIQTWGTDAWSIWTVDELEAKYALCCIAGTAVRSRGIILNLIPASPGEIYTLTARGGAMGAVGAADNRGRLQIAWRDKDGGIISEPLGAWKSGYRWYDLLPLTAKAPANTAFIQPIVSIEGRTSPIGEYVFTKIFLFRSSSLVVQGTPGGARIEMTPDAFRAYKNASDKSVEILAADGSAWFGGKLKAEEVQTDQGFIEADLVIDQDIAHTSSGAVDCTLDKGKIYTVRCRGSNQTDNAGGWGVRVRGVDSDGHYTALQNASVLSGTYETNATVTFFSGPTTGAVTPYVRFEIINLTGATKHFHGYRTISRAL